MNTKDKLWNSLLSIMVGEHKLFSKITIREICTHAQLNRSTFYEYFSDKYLLLEYGVSNVLAPYFKIPFETRIKAPFLETRKYYSNSLEEQLIEFQNHDVEFYQLMIDYSKKALYEEMLIQLSTFETIQLPNELIAMQYVNTIFTVSDWNLTLDKPLHESELDSMFYQLFNSFINV